MKQRRIGFLKRITSAVLVGAVMASTISVINVQAATAASQEEFRKEFANMLFTGDSEVHNIREYNLTWSEYYDICQSVLENEGKIAYRCYANQTTNSTRDGKYMDTFWLINSDAGFQERYVNMLKSIKEVQAGIDENMNEMEKALYIHDYVVQHTYYKIDTFSWVAGGPLGLGYGVCGGYAEAVILLLELEGIECKKVTNPTHGWVAAKLDGEWYHIDPTWDDTRGAKPGVEISHEFFVRNDNEFRNAAKNPHTRWSGNISSSEKYTDWYVHDISGDMLYYEGYWYYEKNGSIVKNNIEGDSYGIVICGSDLKMESIENGTLSYLENGKLYATQVDISESNGSTTVGGIPKATATPTSKPMATTTATPTATFQPTVIATPTPTVAPTVTSKPTVTAAVTLKPTATATSRPTVTAAPTATVMPTATVAPTAMHKPTVTAAPTSKPMATATATPTATSQPTVIATPTAQPTSEPMPEYTKLNYIEVLSSNSNKYFSTGVRLNNRYALEMKLELTSELGYGSFLYYKTTTGSKVHLKQEAGEGLYGGFSWYYGKIADSKTGEPIIYYKECNKIYVNGERRMHGPQLDFNIEDELLFGSGKGKIYYFKIWDDNGELIRDYIPVLDKDGKVCMYEQVADKYIYYNGTGLSYE